ncbi:MAG: alpha/beta fold hydrolase, partial [Kiloniellales bacterium]
SSLAALPLLRSGSLPWRPALAPRAEALARDLQRVEPDAFARAVEAAIGQRAAALLDGIEAYRHHPYRRALPEPPVAWQEGTTRLLDYGALVGDRGAGNSDGYPLLVVPSLINRAYILDLTEETSLLRWLAARGLRPYLVDWDAPGPLERRFTLTDYIAGRLEGALDAVLDATPDARRRPPLLAGYCMGGLLALALAEKRGRDLAALSLLATPWDFHAAGAAPPQLIMTGLAAAAPFLEILGEMPVDLIQALFSGLDPQVALRKFLAFAKLDPASPEALRFVALEDWLNDGVPLAAPVARECLAGWYVENTPGRGLWRVAGRPVDPACCSLPTLCLVPGHDRIVPPQSAAALAAAIPGAETWRPAAGHIGMVVSKAAPERVWQPLLTWLKERASAAG